MKKVLAVVTFTCASSLTALAVADEPQSSSPPTTPAPATPVPVVTPTTTPVTTSTTTVTSAGVDGTSATPVPTMPPPEKDTITIYQTHRPNKAYLYTGGLVFLGSYVPTAVIAGTNDRAADRNLWIPIVGPWLNLADRQCDGCSNETWNTVLVTASGVGQGVGALLMTASLLVPEKVPSATIQAGNVRMNVMPANVGRGGAGVGAVGTF